MRRAHAPGDQPVATPAGRRPGRRDRIGQHERGLSLTQALVQLLEGAFQTIADAQSVGELERQLQAASSELADTRGQLKEAQLGLQAAREREQTRARIARAFAERARHRLAACPRCRHPLNGSDLLGRGRRANCDTALTAMIVPTRLVDLDHNDYLAFLGALGLLVQLTLTKTSTDSSD